MKFFAALVLGLAIMASTVFASLSAIKVEKLRGRTEVVASIMRDDPAETANLMLAAHEMGALHLKDEEVARALGVIDRDLRAGMASPPPYLERNGGALTEPEAEALTAQLDHPDARERRAAAQVVAGLHAENPIATEHMIAALENDAESGAESGTETGGALSTAGRHGIVVLLENQRPPSWTDELRERCKVVLETLAIQEQLEPPTAAVARKLALRLEAALTS